MVLFLCKWYLLISSIEHKACQKILSGSLPEMLLNSFRIGSGWFQGEEIWQEVSFMAAEKTICPVFFTKAVIYGNCLAGTNQACIL